MASASSPSVVMEPELVMVPPLAEPVVKMAEEPFWVVLMAPVELLVIVKPDAEAGMKIAASEESVVEMVPELVNCAFAPEKLTASPDETMTDSPLGMVRCPLAAMFSVEVVLLMSVLTSRLSMRVAPESMSISPVIWAVSVRVRDAVALVI